MVVAAVVSDEPLDPEEAPLDPDDESPVEPELPEEEEEPVAVVDDESHFGAASSSVFGCDDASSACFGVPPQAASASPIAMNAICFEVRMPKGLARFYGGQHSTCGQLPHPPCVTTASLGTR